MEMGSSRRPPFDRSRDLISKKPRLTQETPATRQFQPPMQRPVMGLSSVRFRENNERDKDREPPADDSVRGALQQLQQHEELVNQYKLALAELTFNSKPIITNLTIIAGENLQAAKDIAATICANILEVPSEQKLPSLYLLDSIVKNIGRDYIKHFAARLPEVFCKTYRLVDPSIHPGMQHLFGTWKGVFPLQPLHLIEKELGFPASVNGPSSRTTSSKPDSQSQRQPHSIHVNPKYLEARCLQQSSKMKSADISFNDVGYSEDGERPERIAGAGTERPWMDPSVKLHSMRPQRELRESGLQKQGGGVYGDYDFAPGLSRPLSTSGGKLSERVAGQKWLGAGREGEESISGQRNGYGVKTGIPSYAAVRPAGNIPSMPIQPRTAADRSRIWKKSEEEEFMWDDLGTKVDPGATAVIKKEIWSDDLEREELGGHLPKWPSQTEVKSHIEREHSADTSSSEQKEHVPFGHPRTSHPSSVGMSSFAFPTTALSAFTGRHPSPGQSAINQRPTSPSLSKRDPRQSLVEKDHLRSYSLARSDPLAASFSGQLNANVRDKNFQDSVPSRLPYSNVQKLQPQKSPSPTSSFQQSIRIPFPEQLSSSESELSGIIQNAKRLLGSSSLRRGTSLENQDPIASNAQGQSNISSLLTSVMKTGLLSGTADKVEKLPLVPQVSSSPIISTLAENFNLAAAKSNPLSILNTLISKGLITTPQADVPAALHVKSEGPLLEGSPVVSEVSEAVFEPELFNAKMSSLEPDRMNSDVIQSKKEVTDLIGFEFKPCVLRDLHPAVIDGLSDNLPHRCTECGLQFKLQERLVRHSEWHALKNSIRNCLNKPSRRWYTNSGDWVAEKAGFPFGYKSSCFMEGSHMMREKNEKLVPADESQCLCLLCGELFEDFYSQEKDAWMFKGAIYLSTPSGSTDGGSCCESGLQNMIVHANCMSGDTPHDLKLIRGVKVEKAT